MAEQEQKRKSPSCEGTKTKTEADDELAAEQAPASSERGEKIKAELDDLLDEIDEVLEDNAEEFVRNYVQKGGQ
jgi:ubiquitin-like protein Pup